jgi:hypothetical protein
VNRRALFAVAVVILAAMAAVAIGGLAYHAGVEQGLAEGRRVSEAPPAGSAAGEPYRQFPPFGFWHFAPFGFFFPLFPLLFIFLVFFLIRGLFWGRCGGYYYGPWRGGVPPTFEEWHRQAHEKPDARPV